MTTNRKIRILKKAMGVMKTHRKENWEKIGSSDHTQYFRAQLLMEELIEKLNKDEK